MCQIKFKGCYLIKNECKIYFICLSQLNCLLENRKEVELGKNGKNQIINFYTPVLKPCSKILFKYNGNVLLTYLMLPIYTNTKVCIHIA